MPALFWFYACVIVALIAGWVRNLHALWEMRPSFDGNEIEALMRLVGVIVPPLGGVLGWF